MKNLYQLNVKLVLGLLLGATIFIVTAQYSQQHSEWLQVLTDEAGWLGVVSYIAIMIASIVIAPLGTGFLVPVAATSFGPFLAALYSIIGWTIGAQIAFILARYVKQTTFTDVKFINRIHEYEKKLPAWYLYSLIVALRLALPVDILSYVLGAASAIGGKAFFLTTVIGITPMAFLFTYSSQSTIGTQILVLGVSGLIFLTGALFVKRTLFK